MGVRRTKEQQAGIDADIEARRTWYSNWGGGAPRRPYTSTQRAHLKALEGAKLLLTSTVPGAKNYTEARIRLGYEPQYAEGWRT